MSRDVLYMHKMTPWDRQNSFSLFAVPFTVAADPISVEEKNRIKMRMNSVLIPQGYNVHMILWKAEVVVLHKIQQKKDLPQ